MISRTSPQSITAPFDTSHPTAHTRAAKALRAKATPPPDATCSPAIKACVPQSHVTEPLTVEVTVHTPLCVLALRTAAVANRVR